MTLSISQQYNPFVSPQRDDPHAGWREARRNSPVFYSDVLGLWVVTDYDDIVRVITNPETFKNAGATENTQPVPDAVRAVLAKGLPPAETRSPLVLDAPEHSRIKKVMMTLITPKKVAVLDNGARQTANSLIDAFIADGEADFVTAFGYHLPISMLFNLIGIPHSDAEQLHKWSEDKMALQWGGALTLEAHLAAAQGYVDFQYYLLDLVRQRREKPHNDAITAWINLRVADERPLSDAEIVGLMMGLIAAGHETTTNLMTIGLWHALENRRVWEGLCEDPTRIPAFVDEALRFDNPVATLWRKTAKDVVLSGQHVPAGSRLALMMASANRDETKFSEADVFDPARKVEVVPIVFGRGVHFCVGAALALAVVRTAFEELTRRIPSMRLKSGFTPMFKANATVRVMERLPVEWEI